MLHRKIKDASFRGCRCCDYVTYSTFWAAVVQVRLQLTKLFNCDLSHDSDHKDFLSVWSGLDLKLCLRSERHTE